MTATDTMSDFVARTFEQTGESLKHTLENGSRMIEEMGKMWTQPMGHDSMACSMREKGEKMSSEAFPTMQRSFEVCREAFDRQCKQGSDFMRKAFDRTRDRNPQEMVSVAPEMMKDSFELFRGTVETMTRCQTTMMETWSKFFSMMMTCNSNGHAASGKPSPKPMTK